jgi:hypothetical protein
MLAGVRYVKRASPWIDNKNSADITVALIVFALPGSQRQFLGRPEGDKSLETACLEGFEPTTF